MVELSVKYNIDKVWLLTGTVANRPMDYFNLLKIIKSLLLKIGNTMP
jgi:hypothetical protein